MSYLIRIKKLKELAESWGGHLFEVSTEDFHLLSLERAPFTHEKVGVNFEAKEIYFSGTKVLETSIIHEMGHVFASKTPPKESEEVDFFGWEYIVARHIGLPIETFLKGNSDYVYEDRDICTHSRRELGRILHTAVAQARKAGLVKNFRPLAIR